MPKVMIPTGMVRGAMRAGIPITARALNTFEPKTVLMTISEESLMKANTDDIISGREVPNATMVTPTIKGEMSKDRPILSAELVM